MRLIITDASSNMVRRAWRRLAGPGLGCEPGHAVAIGSVAPKEPMPHRRSIISLRGVGIGSTQQVEADRRSVATLKKTNGHVLSVMKNVKSDCGKAPCA